MLSVVMTSYARRQQLRRLMSAARSAGCAAIAAAASPLLASAGHAGLAVALGAAAVGLEAAESSRAAPGLTQPRRRRVRGAGQASARAADARGLARRACSRLAGPRDLDHVVRSPSGMGFVSETERLATRAPTLRARVTRRAGSRAGIPLPRRGVSGHLRHTHPTDRAHRGGGARRVARPPDARAAPDTAPPSAIVERRDDRASARLTTVAGGGACPAQRGHQAVERDDEHLAPRCARSIGRE